MRILYRADHSHQLGKHLIGMPQRGGEVVREIDVRVRLFLQLVNG